MPAPLTVGSLFSGIGGFDLGLERAGGKTMIGETKLTLVGHVKIGASKTASRPVPVVLIDREVGKLLGDLPEDVGDFIPGLVALVVKLDLQGPCDVADRFAVDTLEGHQDQPPVVIAPAVDAARGCFAGTHSIPPPVQVGD